MKYKIEISEQADKDLRNIYEYIAFELQAPENASGQIDRLEKHILSLDSMPEKYRIYDKEPWKSRGLHILPVDNYVVLYIPDTDTKVVTILRIMYSGRDIDKQLYHK
ncbi:MAG: type II toxin-antitoxin system RelE/ParE family toxin [Lachnobacterium sp.]|nr:type II toxin-antitoxin system RelE/ParE family toxin [Lachnobacterium sp.]